MQDPKSSILGLYFQLDFMSVCNQKLIFFLLHDNNNATLIILKLNEVLLELAQPRKKLCYIK